MPIVNVKGNAAAWPQMCACCAKPGETEAVPISQQTKTRVGSNKTRVETRTWEVPFCPSCAKHVRIFQAGEVLSGFELFSVILGLGLNYPILKWKKRSKAKKQATKLLCEGCSGIDAGVSVSWVGDVNTLAFQSEAFAAAFAAANPQA